MNSLCYNVSLDMIGELMIIDGKKLVKISEDSNIFMVYLDYTWDIVGEL